MLDEAARMVLDKRYLVKNAEGKPLETPEGMFRRVADAVACGEDVSGKKKICDVSDLFFEMMANLEFLPNSPALMNAGRPLGQLSACFVLPVYDSMDSIFRALGETAKIHQTGGGTGFSFSALRPQGDIVATTMGEASGPLSFIKVFNAATEAVRQGGTRRGANMGILRVDHPDIEAFITAKNDQAELTNFNLSVAASDVFMEACEKDMLFGLINPRTKKEVRKIPARSLLQRMAGSAWISGEPGVIFIDAVNRANPTPQLGGMEATNPCGEQPLLPYESCCLGSVNLSRIVDKGHIDWRRLREVVHHAVRFLDNVVEVSKYPLPETERISKDNRKIGLGVMGFAHMLIRLGIAYDSSDAARLGGEIMAYIGRESKVASSILAEERGPFPNYPGSIWEKRGLLQRNATTTTVAPTGTLSLIAGTSGGIEPIFGIRYSRIILGDLKVDINDPLFMEMKDGLSKNEISRLFKPAYDVTWERHLEIQRAFQEHTDNAVSKTVNLPETATPEEIFHVYLDAYHKGLKGITVFRDKSRKRQVLLCGAQQPC